MSACLEIPIAIVGMACRLPGAPDVEAYWKLIRTGRSAIRELPPSRLDRRLYYSPDKGVVGKTYSSLAGIIEDVPFDSRRVPLTEDVIRNADPSHLSLCSIAADALRNGGQDPLALKSRHAGVYVGHSRGSGVSGQLRYSTMVETTAQWLKELPEFANSTHEHEHAIQEIVHRVRAANPHRDAKGGPNLGSHEAARLVSHAFGLDGPYASINAACASSLMAFGMGVRALQLGQVDMAIVGGASHCKFDSLVLFSKAQSASATGSRPFDANADGLIAAEGCVVFVLKTLDKALSNRDRIMAVVRGVGISSDGRGKSLWAPRKEGQIEAVRRCYGSSLEMSRLGMIEAHATSTQVGDETELSALAEVLKDEVPSGIKIPVGSVKGNIGHTLETAGAAGLLKAVLSLQHREIPASIGIEQLNPKINWENVPLFVPQQTTPFAAPADGGPRRAAVNSFGIGGLNAHIVVDEYQHNTAKQVAVSVPLLTEREPIAIIGVGAILPGARTWEQFAEVVLNNSDCRSMVAPERWDPKRYFSPTGPQTYRSATRWGGFIQDYKYDWRKHKIPPKQVAGADPLQFMMLDAVDAALDQAGLHVKEWDRKRTGCIVGSQFTGEFATQLQIGIRLPEFRKTLNEVLRSRNVPDEEITRVADQFSNLVLERMPALLDETGSFTTSTLASRITKTFDLMGGAAAVDAGCVSSQVALEICLQNLLSGQTDMMICVGGQRALGMPDFEELSLREKITPETKISSLAPDAVVPGEGVSVFLLKRLSNAQRDGNPVLATISSLTHARADDPKRSLQKAIQRASLQTTSNSSIRLIEGSGGEEKEFRFALESTEPSVKEPPPHRGNAVSQFGDLGGGSGMVSLLKATSSLLDCEAGSAYVWPSRQNDLTYHITLEKEVPKLVKPTLIKPQATNVANLYRFDAETLTELALVLSTEAKAPSSDFQQGSERGDGQPTRWRLAFAARDKDHYVDQCRLAASRVEQPLYHASLQQKGIFCAEAAARKPLIAFVFPGQGSQYLGMLRDLISSHAPARQSLIEVDRLFSASGWPRFSELAWSEDTGLGKDVWHTQLAMLAADAILLGCLRDLGVAPDRVVGHSYGELVALLAADAWTLETAAAATYARCQAITQCAKIQGKMASVTLPRANLLSLIEQVDAPIFASNYNSPRQTVVAGTEQGIVELSRLLKKHGHSMRELKVPRPFHTPLMQPAESHFANQLADLPVSPVRVPLLSTVSGRYLADPHEIRHTLVKQLVSPVLYLDAIRQLAHEGVQLIIEVGPSQVLSQLNREILANDRALVVPVNHRKRDALEQLSTVQAALLALRIDTPAIPSQEIEFPPAVEPLKQTQEPTPPLGTAVAKPAHHDATTEDHDDLLRLEGSAYEMGWQLGRARREKIRRVLRRCADQSGSCKKAVPALDEATAWIDDLFGDDEWDELQGVADAVGTSVESLAALNIRVYPDLAGGCTHFVDCPTDATSSELLHGANEDLPLGLVLEDCISRSVQVRTPSEGLAYVTFAADGLLGGINGINSQGIAVTSAQLLDGNTSGIKSPGLLHALIVKRILRRATDLNSAMEILRKQRGTGAWNLCISDAATGQATYAECDRGEVTQGQVGGTITASNHSRLNGDDKSAPSHSCARFQRLEKLLHQQSKGQAARLAVAKRALRDRFDQTRQRDVLHPTMNTVRRVDNQLSVVMQPDNDAVWYAPYEPFGDVDEYRRIDLSAIFGEAWQRRAAEAAVGSHREKVARRDSKEVPALEPSATTPKPDWNIFIDRANSVADGPPLGNRKHICQRFLMQTLPWPLEESQSPESLKPVGTIVLGEGPRAETMCRHLKSQGSSVLTISFSQSASSAILDLESAWKAETFPRLIVLSPEPDASSDLSVADTWKEVREGQVLCVYALCQQWMRLVLESKLLDQAAIAGVVRLGGEFGFRGEPGAWQGGALCGLLKAMHVEFARSIKSSFKVRVLDFDSSMPLEAEPEKVLSEIASDDQECEIAYRSGVRHVVRPIITPLVEDPETENEPTGTWVVTGGARGVTSVVARELGQRFGLRLHLLGTTTLDEAKPSYLEFNAEQLKQLKTEVMRSQRREGEPPIRAWERVERAMEALRNLRSLQQAGVSAEYHCCDVSDAQEIERVLAEIRRTDGPIHGVIHGAGYESACQFSKKQRERVQRTLAVKVDGAVNLFQATRADPLRYFLAFGSISGRFGGLGQTDYCMANELLAKLIGKLRTERPDCRSTLFAWHSWDEVGMAVRPESKHIKDLHGIRYMPTKEGAEHLIQEILSGLSESEVLITDWQYYKRFFPDPVPSPRSPSRESQQTKLRITPASSIKRAVLRLADLEPLPSDVCFSPQGACAIWGTGPRATALKQELESLGARVFQFRESSEDDLARLEHVHQEEFIRHIFVMPEASPQYLLQNGSARAVSLQFQAVQKWLKLLSNDARDVTVAAVVNLGGDFGVQQLPVAPDHGGLGGLLKSLRVEAERTGTRSVEAKVIDCSDSINAKQAAQRLLRELAIKSDEVEVSYACGDRQSVTTVRAELSEGGAHTPQPGEVWLVTGGARGVTAQIAQYLAKDYQLNLHLLGRAPEPREDALWRNYTPEELAAYKKKITRDMIAARKSPTQAWQRVQADIEIYENLAALKQIGVTATYHTCDVSDSRALSDVLEEIRNTTGAINGILHGAAVRHTGRVESITRPQLEASLGSKLLGALHLMQLTQSDPLKHFLAFGSVGGREGVNGGSDYAMANEALAKLVGWFRHHRGECLAATFHWSAIEGFGMMTRPQSFGPSAITNTATMTVNEVYQHLRAELRHGLPESEVVFTQFADETEKQSEPAFPLICSNKKTNSRSNHWNIKLDPVEDPFLREHRYKGRPLLPFVVGIEALVEAACDQEGLSHPFEIVNFRVEKPLRFFTDAQISARVEQSVSAGLTEYQLVADFHNRRGQLVQANRVHMTGKVRKAKMPAGNVNRQAPAAESYKPAWYFDESALLYHGPCFRCLKSSSMGDHEGWSVLQPTPEAEFGGPHRKGPWQIPAPLLDAALFSCGIYVYVQRPQAFTVPLSIDNLRIQRSPLDAELCQCHFNVREVREENACFDFQIRGATGDLILQAKGYHAAIVNGAAS